MNTQDARYSAKVPIRALIVMAGFGKEEKYRLPRSCCRPSDELRQSVFPWLEYIFQLLESSEAEGGEHPTARLTFEYYDQLRDVILQDVAVMFLELEETATLRSHTVFQLPVFQSDLFRDFVEKMKFTLEVAEQDLMDEGKQAVDKLLPGVNRQFKDVQRELAGLKLESDTAKEAANAAAESAALAAKSADAAAAACH